MDTDSNKRRFIFVFALVSLNLLFTIKELSLATPVDPAQAATKNNFAEIVDGAVLAQTNVNVVEAANAVVVKKTEQKVATIKNTVAKPKITEILPKQILKVTATAYSSSVDETDSTPNITASGTKTRPGVAASNVLPIGTKFRIPKVYGDAIFTIEDRMHPYYNGKNWIDLWMESKGKAKVFGVRTVEIEIL